MPEHAVGTREEWRAARDELAKLEAEQAQRGEEIKRKRRELPWVPVEKEYEFDTEDGPTSLADGFNGALIHLNKRDVTLICFSRAPIERLVAYKKRMGWEFPYVSTNGTQFPFDFGLALTEEQGQQMPEVKEMIEQPPEWLRFWSTQIGAELKDGLREAPGYIAFARDNGTVYHTYTVTAPDPFVAPFFNFLLDRTPKEPEQGAPLGYRKDEYPD
jgi:predicted dithiol-disulfide oxidoreductase (DUF899 family)